MPERQIRPAVPVLRSVQQLEWIIPAAVLLLRLELPVRPVTVPIMVRETVMHRKFTSAAAMPTAVRKQSAEAFAVNNTGIRGFTDKAVH